MPELWLIAHKVRGEPAFDVAGRIDCPLCKGTGANEWEEPYGCIECYGNGYWWIIPTSGHRAYPWRWWPFEGLSYQSSAEVQDWDDTIQPLVEIQNGIPDDWPDHYPIVASPSKPRLNLAGLFKSAPIRRRA